MKINEAIARTLKDAGVKTVFGLIGDANLFVVDKYVRDGGDYIGSENEAGAVLMHDPLEEMLICVRWYAAYPLSFRQIDGMMAERAVFIDHSTLHRWSMKMLPVLAAAFRRRKRPVGLSWRMDETYVLVCGQWKDLYRAVDTGGDTIDFLLRAKRGRAAGHASSPAEVRLSVRPSLKVRFTRTSRPPRPTRAKAVAASGQRWGMTVPALKECSGVPRRVSVI